ncbi:MAG: C2 family cysteine protease, partial [Gloeomargarita sp. SKYG98]|nr:C2 family cysteine protease [Gloeomargarita sp. SKYG98]
APGTYYLGVYAAGSSAWYSLDAYAQADGAGNTFNTARSISPTTTTTTLSDWVGSIDGVDFYRFTLTQESQVWFRLHNLTGPANLGLFNAAGQWVTGSWDNTSATKSIWHTLAPGTYYLGVYAAGSSAWYSLDAYAQAVDWFDQNLRDEGLRTITRQLALDGLLCRNDMIAILRNAQDGNVIDAHELTDLRTIVTNAARFRMPDHVRVLANKVVHGDPANQWWTGGNQTRVALGNLVAGSSADHMERLIGKWFLGLDRPALTSSQYSYRYVDGSLFQNGISANDVVQGAVGDCYYLATLASIAHEQPSYIQNMFIDNGDGTFTVRFFNDGVADYVTVDRFLPTNSNGQAVYARWGVDNELWVALAEKAYAQLCESGWARPGHNSNSYAAIEGGWMDYVIRQVTGLGAQTLYASRIPSDSLVQLVNSNAIVTVGFTLRNYGDWIQINGKLVVNYHTYSITSYNPNTGLFYLRNPWGRQHVELTFSELSTLDARFGVSA